MKMPRVSTWPSLAEEVSSTTTGIGPNFTPFALCENTMLQGAIKGVTGNGQGFLGECGRSAEGQRTCPPVEPGLILSHQSLIHTQLRMYAFSLDPEKKNYNRTETPKTNLMCILVSLSTHTSHPAAGSNSIHPCLPTRRVADSRYAHFSLFMVNNRKELTLDTFGKFDEYRATRGYTIPLVQLTN